MRPSISEFSFGYAVTEEIVTQQRSFMTSAPMFPSLYEEGQRGGGYDMRIDRIGFPLFLQFKLSHKMARRNCNEVRLSIMRPPFFRMHLMPLKLSQQHNLLLTLDNGSNEVYYIAPFFSSQQELNRHYLAKNVLTNCFIIKPSTIGRLPDNKEHHIATKQNGSTYLFSKEPQSLETSFNAQSFISILKEKLQSENNTLEHNISGSIREMREIINKNIKLGPQLIQEKRTENLSQELAYLSRYFFSLEVIFIAQ